MNTPAHALLNLGALAGKDPRRVPAIALGGLLPDLPMVGFYLYQRLLAGQSEERIWNELYYQPGWQALFDLFNSLPLLALGTLVAWRLGALRWAWLQASMMLHALCDLLVHAEDAHRHFYPLTDWRFESPLSYWDPAHHGTWFIFFEIILSATLAVMLWRRFPHPVPRWWIGGLAAAYGLFLAFAVVVWVL